MAQPNLARLGSGPVRLNAAFVHFEPSRMQAWRGVGPVSLPFADVQSLVMTDPEGFSRGHLVVRLTSGEAFSMSFGSNRLPKMRRIYRELWRRVQEARGETPSSQ
jgi:hypothetical protein